MATTDDATEEVTLYELIQELVAEGARDLHVSMPAKVESYNASKQTVDVVPQLRRPVPDGQDGFVTEALPKLSDVPVCFPRGGGFFVALPIQAGDYVLLVISDRNLGAWLATGSDADPGDIGSHTLDGAVAIPGVFPSASALSNANGSNLVLGSDAQSTGRIELTPGGEVHLGAGASRGVPRIGDHCTALSALSTWAANVEAVLSALGGTVVPNFASGAGMANQLAQITQASNTTKTV